MSTSVKCCGCWSAILNEVKGKRKRTYRRAKYNEREYSIEFENLIEEEDFYAPPQHAVSEIERDLLSNNKFDELLIHQRNINEQQEEVLRQKEEGARLEDEAYIQAKKEASRVSKQKKQGQFDKSRIPNMRTFDSVDFSKWLSEENIDVTSPDFDIEDFDSFLEKMKARTAKISNKGYQDGNHWEQTMSRGLEATKIAESAMNALQPVELHAVTQSSHQNNDIDAFQANFSSFTSAENTDIFAPSNHSIITPNVGAKISNVSYSNSNSNFSKGVQSSDIPNNSTIENSFSVGIAPSKVTPPIDTPAFNHLSNNSTVTTKALVNTPLNVNTEIQTNNILPSSVFPIHSMSPPNDNDLSNFVSNANSNDDAPHEAKQQSNAPHEAKQQSNNLASNFVFSNETEEEDHVDSNKKNINIAPLKSVDDTEKILAQNSVLNDTTNTFKLVKNTSVEENTTTEKDFDNFKTSMDEDFDNFKSSAEEDIDNFFSDEDEFDFEGDFVSAHSAGGFEEMI